MFTIVCYDTPSDRRRRRLARALADYIERVQYSVFEGHLPADRTTDMLKRIRPMMDQSEDSLRVYQLPIDALPRIHVVGRPPLNLPAPFYWIGPGDPSGPGDASSGKEA